MSADRFAAQRLRNLVDDFRNLAFHRLGKRLCEHVLRNAEHCAEGEPFELFHRWLQRAALTRQPVRSRRHHRVCLARTWLAGFTPAAAPVTIASRRRRTRAVGVEIAARRFPRAIAKIDRKSTRLNSSHGYISYAVFCLKKKKT